MQQLVSHMWMTGGSYPDWILEEVHRMRDCQRYHCRPSELAEEDWHTVELHRIIEAAEKRYLRQEAKSRRAKGR